jgi:TPR repeat protein
MTMHSTWSGPTAEDFAAIEKLRAGHSALMKRASRAGAAASARATRPVIKIAKGREKPAGARSDRVTLFTVGAGLAAVVALGAAGFWSVDRNRSGAVEKSAIAGARPLTAGPDAAAKKKLADAMRAAPQGPEGAWAVRIAAPQPPAPPPAPISDEDLTNLREKAAGLITDGQIAGARALLERAARVNDAAALFELAQTYDPQALQQWKTVGLAGDESRARDLYRKSAEAGSPEARRRLSEMEH